MLMSRATLPTLSVCHTPDKMHLYPRVFCILVQYPLALEKSARGY